MCFINSISRGSTRFQASGEKASFEGGLISRLSMAVVCNKGARLRQGTETLLYGTPPGSKIEYQHQGPDCQQSVIPGNRCTSNQ